MSSRTTSPVKKTLPGRKPGDMTTSPKRAKSPEKRTKARPSRLREAFEIYGIRRTTTRYRVSNFHELFFAFIEKFTDSGRIMDTSVGLSFNGAITTDDVCNFISGRWMMKKEYPKIMDISTDYRKGSYFEYGFQLAMNALIQTFTDLDYDKISFEVIKTNSKYLAIYLLRKGASAINVYNLASKISNIRDHPWGKDDPISARVNLGVPPKGKIGVIAGRDLDTNQKIYVEMIDEKETGAFHYLKLEVFKRFSRYEDFIRVKKADGVTLKKPVKYVIPPDLSIPSISRTAYYLSNEGQSKYSEIPYIKAWYKLYPYVKKYLDTGLFKKKDEEIKKFELEVEKTEKQMEKENISHRIIKKKIERMQAELDRDIEMIDGQIEAMRRERYVFVNTHSTRVTSMDLSTPPDFEPLVYLFHMEVLYYAAMFEYSLTETKENKDRIEDGIMDLLDTGILGIHHYTFLETPEGVDDDLFVKAKELEEISKILRCALELGNVQIVARLMSMQISIPKFLAPNGAYEEWLEKEVGPDVEDMYSFLKLASSSNNVNLIRLMFCDHPCSLASEVKTILPWLKKLNHSANLKTFYDTYNSELGMFMSPDRFRGEAQLKFFDVTWSV